jgi:hypothetical protein
MFPFYDYIGNAALAEPRRGKQHVSLRLLRLAAAEENSIFPLEKVSDEVA